MNIRQSAAWLLGLVVLNLAGAAWAQRVVVFDFGNDRRNRVRLQVVRQLQANGEVELVALKDYQRIAAQKGFRGARAYSPEAIAQVSKELPFAAAVTGTVGRQFVVKIYDHQGAQLWSRPIPLRKRVLTSQNVKRLANAITTAAKVSPPPPAAAPPPPPPPPEPEPEPVPEPQVQPDPEDDRPTLPGVTQTQPQETAEARERRLRQEARESHTFVTPPSPEDDLKDRPRKATGARVGPRHLTVMLGGTTIWRSYCSRPGVESCKDYDNRPEEDRPPGDTVNFSPQKPYAGMGAEVHFFPLASLDNPANGIGLTGSFARGFSRTVVRRLTQDGEETPQEVHAVDGAWHLAGTYRYHFGMGGGMRPLVGWVGATGGMADRSFELDAAAQSPLPGSHRRFWFAGLEVAVPIVPLVRIEAGGQWFFSPKAGPDELAGYGAEVQSTGFGAEVGLGGELWGPVGYSLKLRLQRFSDDFDGQGNKWVDGGAAEETYTGIFWGVTASF